MCIAFYERAHAIFLLISCINDWFFLIYLWIDAISLIDIVKLSPARAANGSWDEDDGEDPDSLAKAKYWVEHGSFLSENDKNKWNGRL